ncbi:hypothetical protein H6G89_32790 [Oscillatoria sp. FACHB-1407]|uniref:hypothetical protein n=1 Tax=Oscillatoria sp. FACHB-1407 TaxID=2692847 RepID=UPI0016892A0C|nr:hypothetical protein [Oscillatoria sp. FACHB-1407]MBD2465768.1 hypothetical protein [Oscillatoria sp. FACHB-1407]
MNYGAINLTRNQFSSRIVRELVGERTIDIFTSLTQSEGQGEGGGIVGVVSFLGSRLVGFLTKAVFGALRWLLRNIWDVVVTLYFEVINFDWNQTDAAIQAQIHSNNVEIAGALGQLSGTGLVWLASIGVATALTVKFPVLAGEVALRLAEEGGEEIRSQLSNFLTVTRNSVTRSVVLGTFLTARRMRAFGLSPVTQQKQPWTIAEAVEEKVESIPVDTIRAFVENFLESVQDAIIEVGYVVSYALDDYYSANRMANQSLLGQERAIRLIPDKRVEGESIVLTGQQAIVQQSVQTAIVAHRFIYNRDVGQVVGQPAEDWVKAGVQRRKLTIVFKSKEQPPWRNPTDEERVKECTYTIPEPKRGLTWSEIKTAANRWVWGKYRATANLENGRQMAVHGATASEAEQKLRELLSLSSLELLTLSVTEERDRNARLKKSPRMMFPAYATLLIRRSTAEMTGRTDLSGENFSEERVRIDLWTSAPPPDLQPLG